MKLTGKVVVATGSTRGIGRAIIEACAREGATVVICSRRAAAVEETVATLRGQGFSASGLPVDVAAPGDLDRLMRHALETWGRVDVWLNNAGLSSGYQALEEMDPAEFRAVVQVNLLATLEACRLVLPYFREHGGILVNMSGRGGRGEASPFLTTYAATKAAVASLTKSLARENQDRPVSIHALLPGMVETSFYENVRTSPRAAARARAIPLVLKALGVPAEEAGRLFVEIAAQQPGKATGRVYLTFTGWRWARGIAQLLWYRLTGRLS